jgi:hypothetical protein
VSRPPWSTRPRSTTTSCPSRPTWDVALDELAEDELGAAYEDIEWRFGELPGEGGLTALAARSGERHVSFTVSGSGVTWISTVQAASFRERLMATATLPI